MATLLGAFGLAPVVFGVFAGSFGGEAQLMATLLLLGLIGTAAYLAMAVLALAAVYTLPLVLWRLCVGWPRRLADAMTRGGSVR